jgi:hypothetical protein
MPVTNFLTMNGMIIHENCGVLQRDYVPDGDGAIAAVIVNAQTVTDTWEYWPGGPRAVRRPDEQRVWQLA